MKPHEHLLSFANGGLSFGDHERQQLVKHSLALEHFLQSRAASWVDERVEQDILEVYQNDATPLTTTQRLHEGVGEYHVRRAARACHEYLNERLWLVDGRGDIQVFYNEPRVLEDKTALTAYNAATQLWKGARAMGARGIVSSHSVFDGALKKPLQRRLEQRHLAYDLYLVDTQPAEAARLISSSWRTCVQCKLHLFHNALKWSLMLYVSNRMLMKDAWVVMQSLRQSYEQLVNNLEPWIAAVISFDTDEYVDYRELWNFFGVEDEKWLTLLCHLQLRWRSDCLVVSVEMHDDPLVRSKVKAAIVYLMRFPRWSDSRWGGLSLVQRCLCRCLHVGLEGLAQKILKDKRQSHYYLSGFTRLSPKLKRMMVVVCCTSRVTDRPLMSLLKDDRLALTLPKVEAHISEAANDAGSLPKHIIDRMAELAEISVTEVLDENHQSIATQVAYGKNGLREAHALPWSLGRGDVEANIRALAEKPRTTDDTAGKIKCLLGMGVEPSAIVPAVQLLMQAPWSTKAVEDPHAVGSGVMRSHSGLSSETLLPLIMARQSAVLFRQDPLRRRIANLTLRISKVERRRPERITPRHAFCATLVAAAQDGFSQGGRLKRAVSRAIIKNHGSRWRLKTADGKRKYRSLCADMQQSRRETNRVLLEALRADRKVLEDQLAEREKSGRSIDLMGNCRLSESAVCDYDAAYDAMEETWEEMKVMHAEKHPSVGQPSAAEVATLDLMSIDVERKVSRGPRWIGWACRCRDNLRNVIFRFTRAGVSKHYKFAYGTQDALMFAMFLVEDAQDFLPLIEAATYGMDELETWEEVFSIDYDKAYYSDAGDFDYTEAETEVLRDVYMRKAGLLMSDAAWMPLREYMALVPDKALNLGTTTTEPEVVEPVEWMEDPYMWEFVKLGGNVHTDVPKWYRKQRRPGASGESDDSASSSDSDATFDDLDVKDDMLAQRESLLKEHDLEEDAFTWNIRGGAWTAKHIGVVWDSYLARARTKEVRAWCVAYNLKRSMSVAIRQYDGDANCIALVKLWVARMTFLYATWIRRGGLMTYRFVAGDLTGFKEPLEIDAILRAPECSRVLRTKVGSIRGLKPRM